MQKQTTILILIIIVVVLAIGGVLFYQYSQQTAQPQQQLVGADRDSHGCIGSAGYTWCEAKQKCLRTWEEPCEADQTAGWNTYADTSVGVSVKYPPSWTYQKFNCNADGVAFCPLAGHSSLNCGQTCGADSPESPIYLYTTGIAYGIEPNLMQRNKSAEYTEIFNEMLSTFKFTK